VKEVGFEPLRPTGSSAADPILSVWSDGDMAFQWHQDAIDLPLGADLLATGDRVEVQAFRVGPRAWGTQFHFEIDAAELELWLDEASEVMDLKEVWGKSPAEIRGEARRHMATHEAKGAEMFARFARFALDGSR
jgi:GMP synthase (glutamine-hydrolysing)